MSDTNPNQLPSWAWLLTGVVTGLFLAFLYYLAGIEVPGETQPPQVSSQSDSRAAPKFDFYTVLKDVESMGKSSASNSSQPKAPTGKLNTSYMIQTGSFQSLQDADRRRAELLLLGLDVKTERVEIKPGQIFHRVQVGPFSDANNLMDAKATLTENNIEHIVLTLK